MMKLKHTSRRHRIVIGIIIVITIVISAFLFELLRACLYYGAGWGPKATKIQGIEYYSNGEYLNFHEGKYAAENLPSLEEVNSAVYADFYYSDYTTRETLFGNGAVGFAVGVRYDEKEYCEKREKLLSSCETPAEYVLQSGSYAVILSQNKLGFAKHQYNFVIWSDETRSIVYFTCIDNIRYDGGKIDKALSATCICNSSFWESFFSQH